MIDFDQNLGRQPQNEILTVLLALEESFYAGSILDSNPKVFGVSLSH